MIDRELIIRKLALITGDLAELRAVAQRPREEYLASERGHPPPADYYESFVRLGTLQVLPPDFARHLAPCAGLRNRIVHEYDDIDAARVYEALQAAVKDIPEYVRDIQQHVEATGTT